MPRESGNFSPGEGQYSNYGRWPRIPEEPAQVTGPTMPDNPSGNNEIGRIAHVTPVPQDGRDPAAIHTTIQPINPARRPEGKLRIPQRAVEILRSRLHRKKTDAGEGKETPQVTPDQKPVEIGNPTSDFGDTEKSLTLIENMKRVERLIKPLSVREAVQRRGPVEPIIQTPAFREPDKFAAAWVGFGQRVQAASIVPDNHPAAEGIRYDAQRKSIRGVAYQAEHTLGGPWSREAREAVAAGEPTLAQLYAVTSAVHPDPAIQRLSVPDKSVRHPSDRARANLEAIRLYGQATRPHRSLTYDSNEFDLARLIAEIDLRDRVLGIVGDDPAFRAAADIRLARAHMTPGNKRPKHAVSQIPIPNDLAEPLRQARFTYLNRNPVGKYDFQQVAFGVGSSRTLDRSAIAPPPTKSRHEQTRALSQPGDRLAGAIRLERPTVKLDELSGLRGPKEEVIKACVASRYPEIWEKWGTPKRQRILLEGPQGNGKTSLVHGAADFLGVPVAQISAAQLVSMFQGESPKNFEALFQRLQQRKGGLVVYFSEFEQLAGLAVDAPSDSTDHDFNARIAILKTGLDSLTNPNLIIFADTNNSDRLDPAVIRDGRFDTKIVIGNPSETESAELLAGIMGLPSPTDDIRELDPDDITNTVNLRAKLAQADRRGRPVNFHLRERWQFAADIDPQSLARLARRGTEEGRSRAFLRTVVDRALAAKAFQEATTGEEPPPITQAELENLVQFMLQNGH